MARKRRARSRDASLFISHSSRDGVFVERIVAELGRHGIACWYAPKKIVGAQQWQDEIGRALRRCNWFLIVLSRNALRSKWVKRELAYVLDDNRYDGHIVAIVKTPGDYTGLSWTLSAIQQVDFSGQIDQAFFNLLRVWGVVYRAD
jgi:hypothetical protein